MKIYIAGKITGDKNYKEKFDAVEKLLASQGYSVMNPARLGNYPAPCKGFVMLLFFCRTGTKAGGRNLK